MQVLCYRPERTDTDGGSALSLVVVGVGGGGVQRIGRHPFHVPEFNKMRVG